MKASLKYLALTLGTIGMLAQTVSAQVTIDSVQVYNFNGGNANDPSTGFGAVNYTYSIGKYEVTLNQYNTFLNAVAKTDTYGLYNASMAVNANIAGITQSGASGSFSYAVTGSGDRPVTFVSWFDSARFAERAAHRGAGGGNYGDGNLRLERSYQRRGFHTRRYWDLLTADRERMV